MCFILLILLKGVFLRDLSFIDLGNEDFVEEKKLINFEKAKLFYKVILEIEHFQQRSHHFTENLTIINYLHNLIALPDETLYEYSLLCESASSDI